MSTIRPLLVRIVTLVREHPILIVPLCIADLISFSAMHLQHALHQPLFKLVLGERSVLSASRTFVMTPQNTTKAALLVMPLLWACYILTVVLYTGALLVTSYLVRQGEAGTTPNLRLAVAHLRSNRPRWTGFIFRVLVTLIAAGIILWLLGYLLFRPPLMERFGGRNVGYAIGFLLEALVAASLLQTALILLAEAAVLDLRPLRRPAIILGLITIGLQIALTVLGDRFFPAVITRQTSILGLIVCEAAQSLLGALTYRPLFIGLSILTAPPESAPLPSD